MCLTKPFQKPDNEKYDPLQMTNNYPAVDRYDAIWSSFFRGEKQKQFTQNSKRFYHFLTIQKLFKLYPSFSMCVGY